MARKAILKVPADQSGANSHASETFEEKIAKVHSTGVEFGGLLRLRLKDPLGKDVFIEVSTNLRHATDFLRKQVSLGRVCV